MNFDYQILTRENIRQYERLTFPSYRNRLEEVGDDLWAEGVSCHKDLVGLLLAEADYQNDCGNILSIFVIPKYRNRGVGKELITRVERQCKKRGLESIEIVYTENNSTFSLENILKNRNWTPLRKRLKICRGLVKNIKDAAWLNYKITSSEYKVFPWKDFRDREKRELQKDQHRYPWYPLELCPFAEEDTIYYPSSFGLSHKGKIIGWMITNRLNSEIIRYSSLFIKQEFQGKGFAIYMLASAINNQIYMAEASEALFSIKADNEYMLKLAEKHLMPFLNSIKSSVFSEKFLIY